MYDIASPSVWCVTSDTCTVSYRSNISIKVNKTPSCPRFSVYSPVFNSSPSVQSKSQVREEALGFGHEAHRLDASELMKRWKDQVQ